MRVLFVSYTQPSHHYPMVPLEMAVRAAGHEVLVAAPPALTKTITTSGLPAVAVGPDFDPARSRPGAGLANWDNQERWPSGWPARPGLLTDEQKRLLENLGRRGLGVADRMLDDLLALARRWRPDLVVHDAVAYAGPVTAAALGVPNVSHLWGCPGLQRLEMKGFGAEPSEPLDEYVRLFERVGAPVRTWPSAWVDPCPPSMGFGASPGVHLMQYVPYNGPGEFPEWLLEAPSRPRVCVTWGATTAKLVGGEVIDTLENVIEAVSALPVEIVVATTAGQRDGLGDLPAAVSRVVVSLPLDLLLPTCTAIVHHGGAGTTLTAARHAVRQLTVTRRPEPTLNGERCAHTGAGINLTYRELSREPQPMAALRSHVARLLEEESFGRAAQKLREEILAQPSPADLVPVLEGLA